MVMANDANLHACTHHCYNDINVQIFIKSYLHSFIGFITV